jgi:hypothetical protein
MLRLYTTRITLLELLVRAVMMRAMTKRAMVKRTMRVIFENRAVFDTKNDRGTTLY